MCYYKNNVEILSHNIDYWFDVLAYFVSVENFNASQTGVPLSVIVTFNRMKQLSTDCSVIVAAINASDSGIIEVFRHIVTVYLCLTYLLTYCSDVVNSWLPVGGLHSAGPPIRTG